MKIYLGDNRGRRMQSVWKQSESQSAAVPVCFLVSFFDVKKGGTCRRMFKRLLKGKQ